MDTGDNKKGRLKRTPSPSSWRDELDVHWLERKVHDTYREVVDEPIPKALLDLVDRIPDLDQ